MKKAPLYIALATTLAALAVGAFIYQNRALAAEKAIIYAHLPPIPDLDAQPASLERRIQAADKAIQTEGDPTTHLIELTRLYHANGYIQEALACYTALIQLQPDVARWPHLKATLLAGYGQLDAAIPLFQKAAAADPSYAPTYIRLGGVLLKQNKIQEASSAYASALSAQADHPHALLGIGRCHIARRDFSAALTPLEAAFRQSSGRVGGDLLVSVYAELGQNDKALSISRASTLGAYNDLPDPWQLDLYNDCYDAYQIAIAAGQASFGGNPNLGYTLTSRAASLSPKDHILQYQLGSISLTIGKIAQAEGHFKKCIELQPGFSDGWTSLHSIYEGRGDAAAATATLKNGYKNCPDSPALMILLAKEAKAQGNLQQAADLLKKSTQYRPNEAAAYIEMSKIFFELKQVDQGLDMLRSALQAEPGHPMPLTTLTLDAINRGTRAEADAWLKQVAAHPRIPKEQISDLEQRFIARFGK